MKGRILLVTGPAGSGKSTLADSVAQLPGWTQISEDTHWVQHGWTGHRNEEQEDVVQSEVAEELRGLSEGGANVVLEFILYKKPPNPLTNYIDRLRELNVDFDVVALNPGINTIVEQIKRRGRSSDLVDMETRRENALAQIACLDDPSINSAWVIESNGLSADKVFEVVRERLGE